MYLIGLTIAEKHRNIQPCYWEKRARRLQSHYFDSRAKTERDIENENLNKVE